LNRDYGERWEIGFSTTGEDARHRDCGVETYKRGHCANQIDDGVQPIWADDFLVADFLADSEVPQSKKLNVGVVRVIALRFSLSAKAPFRGAP
jgi:hypothetical protein